MTLIPSTELEAVNMMLSTIGESPVSSLENAGHVDAVIARQTLGEISADVQSRGWHFNTDKGYPLKPEAVSPYEIHAPATAARIEPAGSDAARDIALRGGRIWDRRRHTFSFPDLPEILVDIVWVLPFADLPMPARRYVSIRAARVFQDRVVGSSSLHGFNRRDEERALQALQKFESKTARRNLLTGSASAFRIINRRAR